jgi:BirA family biotin operon repressor/biotin-[acetyl-CoA-carboxylase] ligase
MPEVKNNYFNLDLPFQVLFERFSILESSNKTAWNKIQSNPNINNHIIIADQQSSGRGREGRVWQSPLGNLYFSFIHKVKDQKLLEIMPFLISVALNQATRFFLPNSKILIENKWPNDLLVNGKKIAGILIESETGKFDDFNCVIGIGVNFISNPTDTIYLATNFMAVGIDVEKNQFLKKFLEIFFILSDKFNNFSFTPIKNLWLSNAFRLGKEIHLNLFNKELSGVFEGIDERGFLILSDKNLNKIKINTAEIMPLLARTSKIPCHLKDR